jgi:hypothetical protein
MARFVLPANETRLLFNGIEMTLEQNITCDDNYGLEPVSGIGDIHVAEYPPTLARHRLSLSGYAKLTEPLYLQGIAPENGDEALEANVFDIEIFDKKTGTLRRRYENCSYDGGQFEVRAHYFWMVNANFVATDVSGTIQ